MWGGTPQRNMVNTVEKNIPDTWDITTGQNIKWVAQLGSQAFSTPTVAGGKIFVGTNNQFERQPKVKGDKGVVMCFRESDGKFLWQIVHDKLAAGRVNDWPQQGICSTCCVDGNRVYYVSNRCELVCADVEGANDGSGNGKILWKLDMIKDLGVFPHNMAASSPNIDGDLVYVVTGNGVDESHIVIPAPDAPGFIAVNKMTGEVVWDKVGPGDKILHGQWSSPAIGVIGGVKQVIFPGGDGRLYAYETETGKDALDLPVQPGGDGLQARRPRHAERVARHARDLQGPRVYRHGPGPRARPWPQPHVCRRRHEAGRHQQDGAVWHNDEVNRGLATVAIYDNILYHCDLSGNFRAIDPETGKVFWKHDMGSAVWTSPYYVDGKILMGDEDGHVVIFAPGKEKKILNTMDMGGSVYTTPVAANGVLYISTREKLYAIQQGRRAT